VLSDDVIPALTRSYDHLRGPPKRNMEFECRLTCIASPCHTAGRGGLPRGSMIILELKLAHHGIAELKEDAEVGCGDRKAARNMIVFLLTELDLASAYVAIAQSDSEGEQDRNRKNARKVYETVLRFLAEAALPQNEARNIRDKLATLKSGLQSLGEIF
jgi:hypothetical protein